MAPITAPWSVELSKDADKKDAVADTVATVVAGKVKLFIGSGVNIGRRQSIVGTVTALLGVLLNDAMRDSDNATDIVVSGHWQHASAGSAVVATTIAGLTTTDVALVVSGSFTTGEESHFYEETVNQLIAAYLELSAGT